MHTLHASMTAGWHRQDSIQDSQGSLPSSRACTPTLPALAGLLNSRHEGAAAGNSQGTIQSLLSALCPL